MTTDTVHPQPVEHRPVGAGPDPRIANLPHYELEDATVLEVLGSHPSLRHMVEFHDSCAWDGPSSVVAEHVEAYGWRTLAARLDQLDAEAIALWWDRAHMPLGAWGAFDEAAQVPQDGPRPQLNDPGVQAMDPRVAALDIDEEKEQMLLCGWETGTSLGQVAARHRRTMATWSVVEQIDYYGYLVLTERLDALDADTIQRWWELTTTHLGPWRALEVVGGAGAPHGQPDGGDTAALPHSHAAPEKARRARDAGNLKRWWDLNHMHLRP